MPQIVQSIRKMSEGVSKRQKEVLDGAAATPKELVQQCRAALYNLCPDAIGAIQHQLREKKDARMGYQILSVCGVVPEAEERSAMSNHPNQPRSLTDEARDALVASLPPGEQRTWRLLEMFRRKADAYGMDQSVLDIPGTSPAQPKTAPTSGPATDAE